MEFTSSITTTTTTTTTTPLTSMPTLIPTGPPLATGRDPGFFLPKELVDMIVDYVKVAREDGRYNVKDLASLGLTAKCFARACRIALFRTLIIPVKMCGVKLKNTAQDAVAPSGPTRLDEVLEKRPELAEIIRRLKFRFVDPCPLSWNEDSALASALDQLKDVSEVLFEGSRRGGTQISFQDVYRKTEERDRSPLELAVMRILEGGTVKRLVMYDMNVPAVLITRWASIQHVESYNSKWLDEGTEIAPLNTRIRPTRFIYDGDYDLEEEVFRSKLRGGMSPFAWDKLKKLSMSILDAVRLQNAHILGNASGLEELNIQIYTPVPLQPDDEEDLTFSEPGYLLEFLHNGAHKTLKRMSLSIDLNVWEDNAIIDDPFWGIFTTDEAIQEFINLEELSMRVKIHGAEVSTLNEDTFASRWGSMAEALAPEGRQPPYEKLRKVSFTCEVHDAKHQEAVKLMLEEQFGGLRDLEKDGRIKLVLESLIVDRPIDEQHEREAAV
ncbi:hypothetical protein NMY22_g4898 [Coprinellus aureogranulatus]|nr:hypothetical protein NMY22_g4898 [Coprinellus aureogranulatus]